MDFISVASILCLLIGLFVGGTIVAFSGFTAGKKSNKILDDAKKEAEKTKRNSLMELKEETFKLQQATDREIKERKSEIKNTEDRLLQREKSLDKREELLQNRDNSLEEKDKNLSTMQKKIQEKEVKMDELLREEIEKLESIAKLSREKAHDLIMQRVEDSMSKEIAEYIKDRESEAKLEVDKKAKELLVNSMEKYANDVTTIQTVTGVDLLIDDTPEAISISSFDPFRREIAKQTIETLVKDGRIHPTRIEEIYDKICKDMNARITEIGNDTIRELGLTRMDSELVKTIGKLNFRTSYGQNALQHSKEVSYLCGIMAAELGENVNLAKRAGLLHDIGKAIDFEMEGSHVEIGADLAKKYGENEVVINSIESHHGDKEAKNIISVLVSIADTMSASRPGARNDTMENYIKRLEELETIGNSFEGVDKTFAMQAGRELRVIVKPDKVDDLTSFKIAREIKERIESEMQYPGTIKITVIRETRAQEEAK